MRTLMKLWAAFGLVLAYRTLRKQRRNNQRLTDYPRRRIDEVLDKVMVLSDNEAWLDSARDSIPARRTG